MDEEDAIIELNVGGQIYTSTTATLISKKPNSKLALLIKIFLKHQKCDLNGTMTEVGEKPMPIMRDSQNRLFIDRDGAIFRYILDYLRWSDDTSTCDIAFDKLLPTKCEKERLKIEADFFGLVDLSQELEMAMVQTEVKELKECNETKVGLLLFTML